MTTEILGKVYSVRYIVSSVNKIASNHRRERTAQVEARKRLLDEDTEVTIECASRTRYGWNHVQVAIVTEAK